jgi:hypothetical protein
MSARRRPHTLRRRPRSWRRRQLPVLLDWIPEHLSVLADQPAGQYGEHEGENGDVEPSSASRFPPTLNGRGA